MKAVEGGSCTRQAREPAQGAVEEAGVSSPYWKCSQESIAPLNCLTRCWGKPCHLACMRVQCSQ